MSWPTPHRVAHIAAVQAHHDLGMTPGRFPVPVESAITTAGLPLHWRPLGRLFGIYLQVEDAKGILLNERLTRSARRHTAPDRRPGPQTVPQAPSRRGNASSSTPDQCPRRR